MSGEKDRIINLRESDYDRLMDNVREVERQGRIQSLLANSAIEMASYVDQVTEQHNRQLAGYQQRLSQTSQHVRDLEQNIGRQLSKANQQIQDMKANFGRRLDSLDQKIDNTRQILETQIAETRQFCQNQINDINKKIKQKEISEEKAAQTWFNDVTTVIDAIKTNYDHQKFMPGAIDRLTAELTMTQANINGRVFQAAIAKSQETFLKAQELRLELEQKTRQWNEVMIHAQGILKEALIHIDTLEGNQLVFETEDGPVQLDPQVDYWTQGGLTALREQASGYQQQLQDTNLSFDQLKELTKQLEMVRDEADRLMFRTREAIVASQLRNNIAQTIESSLLEAGWQVKDSAYESENQDSGNGFANAFHLKLENVAGDEMVTIIMPEGNADGTIANRLRVSFHPKATADIRQNETQANHIGDILRESGLNTGEMTCTPGTENTERGRPENLDFDSVRRAEPKQKQQRTSTAPSTRQTR